MTPAALAAAVARDYPGVWESYDLVCRAPPEPWPVWCYCPLAMAMAVASGGRGDQIRTAAGDVARIGAAAAWRVQPLVWRGATADPTDAPLPTLLGLPRWCTWVEPVVGPPGWIHLEADANDGRAEFRLALLLGDRVVGVPVHLDQTTLAQALDSALAEAVLNVGELPSAQIDQVRAGWRAILTLWLPLAMRLVREPYLAQPWGTP